MVGHDMRRRRPLEEDSAIASECHHGHAGLRGLRRPLGAKLSGHSP